MKLYQSNYMMKTRWITCRVSWYPNESWYVEENEELQARLA